MIVAISIFFIVTGTIGMNASNQQKIEICKEIKNPTPKQIELCKEYK